MRGAFIWLLLVLVLGAVFGWLLQQDAGYVLIQFHGYTVETSLWIGIGLLVSAVIGAGLLLTLLRALIAIVWMALGKPRGGVFAQWRRYWAQQKNRAANRAVADFYRGRWRRTLRPLARAARKTDAPLVYQLLAARCAEELGDRELSEGFLELAAADPNAGDVVAVARAEMAARRGDHAGALALLESLNADAATHPSALRLQAELLAREQRWEHLAPRLPELRRHQVMPADALDRLELATQSARLEMRRTQEQPLDAVRKLWQSLPGRVRAEVELSTRYAEILCELGAGDEAASLLLDSLKNRPDERLIRAYGMSPANDAAGQLAKIETMLKREPENPALLLAAGRIAARNRLWGKARDYLQASEARAENRNEVRAVLASLPEKAAV